MREINLVEYIEGVKYYLVYSSDTVYRNGVD